MGFTLEYLRRHRLSKYTSLNALAKESGPSITSAEAAQCELPLTYNISQHERSIMAFEVLPGDFSVKDFAATVHEHTAPVTSPATVIRADQEWAVFVTWKTFGTLSAHLPGTWHVGLFIESIGPGPELEIALQHVLLTPGPGDITYSVDLVVPANALAIPNHQSIPFKVVTTVTFIWQDGTPGPMAGYLEGPIVQIYNP